MSPSRPSPTRRPPVQGRSQATLERIVSAAEALLDERLFGEVSMADIAARAGVSVGVIYTRFEGKDALLPALFERHDAAVAGRLAGLFESLERETTLLARIERVVAFAIEYNRRHRGLLRALTVYVRAHPESVPARTFRERAGQYRAVAAALLGDRQGVSAAQPVETAEFLLGVVNSVCRDELLFDDVSPLGKRRRGVRALERHLVHLVHSTLTTVKKETR